MAVRTPTRGEPGIEPAVAEPGPAPEVGGAPAAGRGVPRLEGPAKLTGAARYVDDLVVPGAWYGATVRSTDARARLLGIERGPGVDWSAVVVVTAADIPGVNAVSLMVDDQPALVIDEIRHVAEPVALVAAADPETARAARDALRLVTDPLPPVLDPLESSTAFKELEIATGDLARGFEAAELVLEGTYRTGHAEQLYIEPQGMIAIPRDDGGVTVHGSLQCPHYVHTALARALGLGHGQVTVVQAETGGGFGGKEEYPSMLAIHAALLARASGRPVRMIYDRHEDLLATTKRHPSIVRHRTGVTGGGRLVAQEIEVVLDAGAYTTLSPVVLSRAAIHATGPYACQNVRVRGRAVRTNTPPNGAFRGFGAPQAEFAAETHLNRIAEALGMSAVEIRRRNAYREGDATATGQILRESVGALDVLERAAAAAGLEGAPSATAAAGLEGGRSAMAAGTSPRASDRGAPLTGIRSGSDDQLLHGIGIALGWHGAGFTGSGEAYLASRVGLELTADGRLVTRTGLVEMGQGSRTVLAQLVAETLGVDPAEVEIAPIDTSAVPDSGPTVASRTTMVGGGLLVNAARHLRNDVEARTRRSFPDSYRDDARRHGPTRVDEQFHGFPGIEWDEATYRGDAYPAYGWTCAVATVEVDPDTAEVRVTSIISANDAGRIVHRVMAEGQVEGGTLQAIGYATLEEIQVRDGRYLNDRLATYLIPTALDAPRIEAILVERPYAGVPHGAKGLGELPMDVPAPAVVAAIHDATGVWIHELPVTPEKLLAAMRAREAGDAPASDPGGIGGRPGSVRTPPPETDPPPPRPETPR